jgi:hypothetical protein
MLLAEEALWSLCGVVVPAAVPCSGVVLGVLAELEVAEGAAALPSHLSEIMFTLSTWNVSCPAPAPVLEGAPASLGLIGRPLIATVCPT